MASIEQNLSAGHRATTSPGAEVGGALSNGGFPTPPLPPLSLSVVLPTKDEVDNVEPLLDRLAGALPADQVEIIFVDDSDDGTAEAVERELVRREQEIRLIHRPPEQRGDGLSGAVIEGIRAARAPWVCVMDADLQHPPEVIAELLTRAARGDADLVAASRYAMESDPTQALGRVRTLISHSLIWAARGLVPSGLRGLTDPLTGFFLVRRDALDLDLLQPRGFKILLEILGRTKGLRVAEIGFEFGRRHAGQSKASATQVLAYMSQLWHLRFRSLSLRLSRFGLVGLSGLVVNTLVLAFFTDVAGIYYLLSAVLATQLSTLWNFVLTELWVFRGRSYRHGLPLRVVAFYAMNNAALALRGPMLAVLVSAFGVHYLVANVISLLVLTLMRFAVADSWIWASADSVRGALYYDLHGIITIRSAVRLRELEWFRVNEAFETPTIDVRIGKVSRRAPLSGTRELPAAIRYSECLGRLGFATEIRAGGRLDVVASHLLRLSPHVLYTNIVEPILRWTFVEKGYALVHAACVAVEGEAFIVTARTDTGKTTTILKTLDNLPWAFLSDDLTLVSPDGRLLTYPKPMTISRHTARAVKTPLLSRSERLALIVQSRLHSRTGRKVGLRLARPNIPAATMNAVVQAIIPPPKYGVERLVPHAKTVKEAHLAGMVLIQRGGVGATALDLEDAVDILMANCEDAYGFPPYHSIERFLHSRDGADLCAAEREIVAQALLGTPATLLRSETMDWWQRLPSVAQDVLGVLTPGGAELPGRPAGSGLGTV